MAEQNTKETLLEEELKEQKMRKTILDRIKGFYDENRQEIKFVGFGVLKGLVIGAATIVGAKLTFDALNKHESVELAEVEKQPELYGEEIITEDGDLVIKVVEGE